MITSTHTRAAAARRPAATLATLAGLTVLALAACSGGKRAADGAGGAGAAGDPNVSDSATGAVAGTSSSAGAGAGTAGLVTLTAAQKAHVHMQTLALTSFQPTVQTTGTVAFDQDISTSVLAPISGPVTRIVAHVGTYVHRGDPLAYVTSPDFAAAVSNYRKAQGTAVQNRRNATLDEQLFRNDAIARRDLEQAETDARAAEADRDAAEAQLRALGVSEQTIAGIRANQSVGIVEGAIRAPIEGTVVEQIVNPGQLLAAGTTPTFTVADLSTMWVMGNIFETNLPLVHKGDRADVSTAASPTPFAGRVDYVSAEVDSNTHATPVRIVVPNTGRILKKDMYVQVDIQSSQQRRGLLVPVAAVLRDEQNLPYVYAQAPGTQAFGRRQVTLGGRVGDRIEVVSGLRDGDTVITEGGLFLQFAQSQ